MEAFEKAGLFMELLFFKLLIPKNITCKDTQASDAILCTKIYYNLKMVIPQVVIIGT
jgi:hypothetical protein